MEDLDKLLQQYVKIYEETLSTAANNYKEFYDILHDIFETSLNMEIIEAINECFNALKLWKENSTSIRFVSRGLTSDPLVVNVPSPNSLIDTDNKIDNLVSLLNKEPLQELQPTSINEDLFICYNNINSINILSFQDFYSKLVNSNKSKLFPPKSVKHTITQSVDAVYNLYLIKI